VSLDRFGSLTRPPLNEAALRVGLTGDGRVWRDLSVVEATGSTNSDLADAARAGAEPGLVLVAEEQLAGRGRLGRGWVAPARSALTFSVLLRPAVPVGQLGWLPLLAGLAVAEAVGRIAELEVQLKWPNDLLVGQGKLGGVLAERVGASVVVGVGINVSATAAELPAPTGSALPATSLAVEAAACTDRDPVLRAVLRRIAERYAAWDAPGGDPQLAAAYAERCSTLGRVVRAEMPGGRTVEGTATGLDDAGRLGVRPPGPADAPPEWVSAGDVVHLR
jgi:BirA family transcriptional regulator, biotin operon repressor / biotin---[acetyl-CoA-carboxylase] ligase